MSDSNVAEPLFVKTTSGNNEAVAVSSSRTKGGSIGGTSSYCSGFGQKLTSITGAASEYVKLNVGGSLHYTTIGIILKLTTLTKQDSMLRAMFSGRMEVLTDSEGWVLIDRCGKHFPVILNFLRDGSVALPDSKLEIMEIMAEAKYYCLQGLIDTCQIWLDVNQRAEEEPAVCRIPIICTAKEEKTLLHSSRKPAIKLLLNRGNNKYSYTNQSDDNLLKNLELFDKLATRFSERVLFIKDVGAANEVCSWTFYGHARKVAEVEFPEARIYEEAMSVLLCEERPTICASCHSCGEMMVPSESSFPSPSGQERIQQDKIQKARAGLRTSQ